MGNDEYSPRRVVSLQPSATLTLRDLGCLDRLVACTRYCAEVCPEVRALGTILVHDSWTAQAAPIVAAKPDLVIASVPYQIEAVAEILKSGVRFLGLAPKSLRDIYTDMASIGGILGAGSEAHALITLMQARIDAIRQRTSGLPKQTVYCEEWGKPLIASQPWVAELIAAAGGKVIAAPGKTTSADAVEAANPDVILAAWCGAGNRVPLEKIVEQRNWHNLAAVRSGRVFCIPDELLNTPASSLLQGLEAIAAALHPDVFPAVKGMRAMRRS